MANQDSMIYSLQAYRGLAAALVVLGHTNAIMAGYFGSTPFSELFGFGHAGVQFFFVLSGYIIFKMHVGDAGNPRRLPAYFLKRFIRIYPIYWMVTIAFLPFWLFVPAFGEPYHKELTPLIKSLILLPQVHAPHVQVGWTLVHEIFFYLAFGTLIVNRTLGILSLFLWLIAYVTTTGLGISLAFPASFFLNKLNLLFLFGMTAASITARFSKQLDHPLFILIFILGNFFFLAAGLFEVFVLVNTKLSLVYGFAAFMIIVASGNKSLETWWKRKRLALFLGDASYSIYLIHPMMLSFMAKVIVAIGFNNLLGNNIIFAILFLSSLLIGSCLHVFIEKPLLCKLRRQTPTTSAN